MNLRAVGGGALESSRREGGEKSGGNYRRV